MVAIGVVGVGWWGQNHLRVLKELGALKAFCDINVERLKELEERFGVRGYPSLEDMVREERLDAVTICTPATSHFGLGRKALEAGLDTFIEKPFTTSSKEGEELLRLAKELGRRIMVGFIERFNPAIRELKAMLKRSELGEPLLLEFHRENRAPERVKDVGIVVDASVHDIDTARWIFEEEPRVVFSRLGKVLGEHEDFASILMGFRKQRTAFLMSNWVTPKRLRTLTVVCTSAVVTVDFLSQEIKIDDEAGTRIPRRSWQEPLLLELTEFVKCVKEGREPPVTAKDGLQVLRIAEAALISGRSGTPIYLELS